jgi:hypothetical protein
MFVVGYKSNTANSLLFVYLSMKRYLPATLLLFCSFISADSFTTLSNLAGGTWQMKTKNGYICERWIKVNNSELKSTGFIVKGKDTTILEQVRLINKADGIFYIPIVNGQNSGEPTSFKLISSANNEFIFSNPQHDFPQRVVYHFIKPDSIYAWVDGEKNGKYSKENFYYSRVK